MARVIEGLKMIAGDLINASKKRRQIGGIFKSNGLVSLKKGSWLSYRGSDIVSGFIIEGSPSDTYISAFILPVFDKLEFISWSLGDRIVHCSADRNTSIECEEAFTYYRKNLMHVKSTDDLLRYLDESQIVGFYPIWVRYLCYLQRGDFERAVEYLDDRNISELHCSVIDQFLEVNKYAIENDKVGVEAVLRGWRFISERLIGHFDREFNALSDNIPGS